jgi:predicted GTPase
MPRKSAIHPALHAQTQVDVFGAIETNYWQLDDGFDLAYAACKTAAQRKQLRETLSAAEDAYWAAVADALADNSTFVQQLRDDLVKKNLEVQRRLENLKDVSAFLTAATESTRLAAALARLAAI